MCSLFGGGEFFKLRDGTLERCAQKGIEKPRASSIDLLQVPHTIHDRTLVTMNTKDVGNKCVPVERRVSLCNVKSYVAPKHKTVCILV